MTESTPDTDTPDDETSPEAAYERTKQTAYFGAVLLGITMFPVVFIIVRAYRRLRERMTEDSD